MPKIEYPIDDNGRFTALQLAYQHGQTSAAAGDAYLSSDTLTRLGAFLAVYEAQRHALMTAEQAYRRSTRQRREAMAALSRYTRDFATVLRRRVLRMGEPPSVFAYYGLPEHGRFTPPTRYGEWLTAVYKFIQGDALAVADGLPPMCNPSAAELEAVREEARVLGTAVNRADRAFDEAQEAVAAQRAEADLWLRDIVAELRYRLRRYDPPSRRRIMRRHGVTFVYRSHETRDEDDPDLSNSLKEEK